MNRPIKFRALRQFDGLIGSDQEWIHSSSLNLKTSNSGEPRGLVLGGVRCQEETLGQFTGLTDRNGVEIYEGDLVSNNFGIGAGRKEVVRQVAWDNAAFKLVKIRGKSSLGDTILLGVFVNMNFAVIGNIHTHPELIENESK